MRIFLVRHSKTIIDKKVKSCEWGLVEGYENDSILREVKKLSGFSCCIYSSDETKAILTSEIIRTNQKIIKTKWLREVDRGDKYLEDYTGRVKEFFNFSNRSMDEWETGNSAIRRFLHGLQKIETDGDVILVGHGLMFSLFRAKVLGQEKVKLDDWQALLMPDYAIIEKQADAYRLVKDFEGIKNK